MKYTVLMLVFFGFMTCGFAQSIDFDLASPQPILNETYGGSILSGDLDNDGDIDVVPMEGFDGSAYNEILGLEEKGLQASVVLAVGYRSEDDKTQHAPKVRKSIDDLFELV